MDKREARARARMAIFDELEEMKEYLIGCLQGGVQDVEDLKRLREAFEAEVEHFRKRAFGNAEGAYGRNRGTVHRVYETRIDCKRSA